MKNLTISVGSPPAVDLGDVEFPRDAARLIELLDQYFPHRCKNRGESEEDHQRYAGAREMIDGLVEWKNSEIA